MLNGDSRQNYGVIEQLEGAYLMDTEFIAHYCEPDKKPQSVQKHLQEVSEAACIFAGKVGLSSIGELGGLIHDFGKYPLIYFFSFVVQFI